MKKIFKTTLALFLTAVTIICTVPTLCFAATNDCAWNCSYSPASYGLDTAKLPEENTTYYYGETPYMNISVGDNIYIHDAYMHLYKNGSLYFQSHWEEDFGDKYNYFRYWAIPVNDIDVGSYYFYFEITYSAGSLSNSTRTYTTSKVSFDVIDRTPSITTTSSNIILDLSKTNQSTITVSKSCDLSYSYYYSYSKDSSAIACSWGEWVNRSVPLTISGVSVCENVPVTISLIRDSDDSVMATKTIYVTVIKSNQNYDYTVGDIIEFGSYPQSKVTDVSLISKLNSLSLIWKSYGYYSGTGQFKDGKMKPGDYMKYADVSYNGEKYRAVYFTAYRPLYPGFSAKASSSFQDDNGYYTDTVYWFKYEPIKWRILDPTTGFVMCETLIDSQPFNNFCYDYWCDLNETYYGNDYANSSIRKWLNDDFYNIAFSDEEKSKISTTKLINEDTCDEEYQYNGITIYDKVFLLTYDEMKNSQYGFSGANGDDSYRTAKGTDYALCQGLCAVGPEAEEYFNIWASRTPTNFNGMYGVNGRDGEIGGGVNPHDSYDGVRPAMIIDLNSDDCDCRCHDNGILGFFYKILLFFQRLFGLNKTCVCGVAHY